MLDATEVEKEEAQKASPARVRKQIGYLLARAAAQLAYDAVREASTPERCLSLSLAAKALAEAASVMPADLSCAVDPDGRP